MRGGGHDSPSMQTEGFISAGYFVVRRIPRPDYLTDVAEAAAVVSASDYLVPVLPSVPSGWLEAVETPPGRFSGFADAAQGNLLWALEADLASFGMDGSLSASICDFLSLAWARGDFHPPSAFVSPQAARRFVRLFGPVPADAILIGLALRTADAAAVATADAGRGFASRLPPCGIEPADSGELLGFDVYRVEDGELHPWLRDERAARLIGEDGCRPNGSGLLSRIEDAATAAQSLADEGGAWFPWRISSYPLHTA